MAAALTRMLLAAAVAACAHRVPPAAPAVFGAPAPATSLSASRTATATSVSASRTTPAAHPTTGRRAAVAAASAFAVQLASASAHASTRDTLLAPGSAERCEGGEGDACEQLAEGNALIARLQAQSRANREKNARELYEKTVRQLGYSDYFDAVDKNLVQLPDGKYALLDAAAYSKMIKDGKIKRGSVDQVVE